MDQVGETRQAGTSREAGNNAHNLLRDIDELVQRWNGKHDATVASPLEAYVNGDIDLLFKHPILGDSKLHPFVQAKRAAGPAEITSVLRNGDRGVGGQVWHEVRNFAPEVADDDIQVVADRNEAHVLVWRVKGMDEVKECVPSRFAVTLKADDGCKELWTDLVGQSCLSHGLKAGCPFVHWKLDNLVLPRLLDEGQNDRCVGMIDGGSEVVDGITAPEGQFVYHGFVTFGVGGSPAGFGVCLDNVLEGAFLREHIGDIVDVLRGPINLEARRLEQVV